MTHVAKGRHHVVARQRAALDVAQDANLPSSPSQSAFGLREMIANLELAAALPAIARKARPLFSGDMIRAACLDRV